METEKNIEKEMTRFRSTKEKMEWNDPAFEGDQYKFEFPLDSERREGDAQMVYRKLDWFGRIKDDKLHTILTERGVKPDEIIAQINEFYPNGRGLEEDIEKYMKGGYGSEVLNFLIDESKAKGAKVIFVFSIKSKMHNFLNKHGFEPLEQKERNMKFFKILD